MKIPTESKLAIQGGDPVFPAGPPGWPCDDPGVRAAVDAALEDGSWGRYHGPHGDALAVRLAELHDTPFVHLCCSGTLGVELALRGLGVSSGDEVILAAYDFRGNFRAVESIGARPVLVDIRAGGWCLDTEQIAAAHSSRTRALIVSHLHGELVDMRALMENCHELGIQVVEDACQVPGAIIEGRSAGGWGDVAVMSFGGSKLLTAGRGGAVLTRHESVFQRAQVFGERGNAAFPLSELQAAVLLPQLDQLSPRNSLRRQSVARLLNQLTDTRELLPAGRVLSPDEASFFKVPWRWRPAIGGGPARDEFLAAMQAEGVAIGAGFRGFAGRSDRRCRKVGGLSHSIEAAEATVLLHHPVLLQGDDCVDRVGAALRKVAAGLRATSADNR